MDSGSLIVDKPLVCGRGLPGRLSSHCSSIQHGRSTALTSSLVALPASLGLLRPVSRTARGLRAPRLRRPSVPALRTALAFGGAVFRRCGRLLGVSSRLQPLRGLCLRTACARASSRFAASNGQRPGRECIFPANASICSAKNARNDVHAVISDFSLVLPILCQCSESRYPAKGIAALIFI